MKQLRACVALMAGLSMLISGCTDLAEGGDKASEVLDPKDRSHSTGSIKVTEVADGLKVGWDIGFLPSGNVLIPQRPGKLSVVSAKKPGTKVTDITNLKDSKVTDVDIDLPKPLVNAEGGLLGMVLHPDFKKSRKFTLCQTTTKPNGKADDIRLITWRLSEDEQSATKVKDLITGLPLTDRGQHVGCKPTVGPDGELLIGTGDGWKMTPSQDKKNLGGKVLRVDWNTGKGLPDNPFADAKDENTRRIWTYGHRNVQGVAVRPGTKEIWTVEHGPGYDDEINLLGKGKNFGYDISQGGKITEDDPKGQTYADYENDIPMTDKDRFPDAVGPRWATGSPTEAISQDVFLEGKHWGKLEGALAVTSLKGSKLFLMTVDGSSNVVKVDVPKELDEYYKRLRAARMGPDGALYITTAGGENDYLLRVEPGKK